MTIYSHFFWNWLAARGRSWQWPFAIGAILPDLLYAALMIRVLFEERAITWGDLAAWEAAVRNPYTLTFHSYVPAGLLLGLSYAFGWRWLLPWLWGVLTHVALDMLTHVSDAYPVFWPLSSFRFPAPVSYWEPEHGGRIFMLVEHGAMAVAVVSLSIRAVLRRARA